MKSIFLICLSLVLHFGCADEKEQRAGSNHSTGQPDLGNMDQGDTTPTHDVMVGSNEVFKPKNLRAEITHVQPMTGIVLWEDDWNEGNVKKDIQLEYAYFPPKNIVKGRQVYDWSTFDAFLDRVAGRGHQAIPRFYYAYVGRKSVVPDYIKEQSDYQETKGTSEGKTTWFPDWRNAELQSATLDFLSAFAERYDGDPRIAFLQVGFGLWGEYHIYDGPHELGKDFPSHAFQKQFIELLDKKLKTLKWAISIDAGRGELSVFPANPSLKKARFGNFDDSFMHKDHKIENEPNWEFFGYKERFKKEVLGGEFSYFTDFEQKNVLNPEGLYGFTFKEFSKLFYITYMIGNDQPSYTFKDRIAEAGMNTGYKFTITLLETSDIHTRVEIKNEGVAPLYYDAFPAIDGVKAAQTLRGLLPGKSKTFVIAKSVGTFSIECDHLVSGQKIEFKANL